MRTMNNPNLISPNSEAANRVTLSLTEEDAAVLLYLLQHPEDIAEAVHLQAPGGKVVLSIIRRLSHLLKPW